MGKQLYDHFRFWILGLAALVTLSILGATMLSPKLEYDLPAEQIGMEQGKAFIVSIPTRIGGVFRIKGDWIDGSRSSLKLYEDGVELAPSQAHHDVIRLEGAGAYSHWGNALWFSVPDGTDPRSNGRVYSVEVGSFLPVWYLVGALASLAAVCILFFRERVFYYLTSTANLSIPILRREITPIRVISGRTVLGLTCVAIAASISLVLFLWWGPFSQGLHIAGYLPVSDALGWLNCGMGLASVGDFFDPAWCSRRVLHPSFLATFLVASFWYGQVALLLLAALVGVAILSISIECARHFGRLPALICAGVLGAFAWEFALARFMTEITGLCLGIAGLALLLRYTEVREKAWLLFGIALISIGLTARAGALLALPALFVWGVYASWQSSRWRNLRWSVAIAMAVAFGPMLHFFLLLVLGLDTTNSGGNFSVVLYGLSTGSRDWSEAYRDFPELFELGEAGAFKQIFAIALENIWNSPGVFLSSLYVAGEGYVGRLFDFAATGALNDWLTAFLIVGLLACVRLFRSSLLCSLLLTLAIAELASAPLVFDSGGHRVLAASVGVRTLLLAFGVHVFIGWLTKPGSGALTFDVPQGNTGPILPAALGAGIIAAILLPTTPVANLFRLDPVPGIGCSEGRTEIVARLDRESQTLGVVSTKDEESVFPYRLTRERLVGDKGMHLTWFANDVVDLPPKSLVIRVFQREEQGFGTFYYVFWTGELPDTRGEGLASICVDFSRSFMLAEVAHVYAVSMTPLPLNPDE